MDIQIAVFSETSRRFIRNMCDMRYRVSSNDRYGRDWIWSKPAASLVAKIWSSPPFLLNPHTLPLSMK